MGELNFCPRPKSPQSLWSAWECLWQGWCALWQRLAGCCGEGGWVHRMENPAVHWLSGSQEPICPSTSPWPSAERARDTRCTRRCSRRSWTRSATVAQGYVTTSLSTAGAQAVGGGITILLQHLRRCFFLPLGISKCSCILLFFWSLCQWGLLKAYFVWSWCH